MDLLHHTVACGIAGNGKRTHSVVVACDLLPLVIENTADTDGTAKLMVGFPWKQGGINLC